MRLCSCALIALFVLASVESHTQDSRRAEAGHAPAPARASDSVTEPGARSPRNASYDIQVRLDHAARTLRGRETLHWRNISTQPATELQFHLYWNAWRNGDSTWMRERRLLPTYTAPRADAWGSIDVTAIRMQRPGGGTTDVTAQLRYIAPDDGNTADRTVMTVSSPSSVQPNDTVQVEIEWTAKIPRPFSRTGYIDDYYFIAQWFPKIGVLEETGWNTHQFHSATEFYADFGVYTVDIIVPRSFVVGASGREVQRIDNGDGTTTHRYRGEDIHDFAWTASPRFLESRRKAGDVEMRLLLQPEHAGQEERHFTATADTLRLFGEWFGPYPYPNITIVDPAYQSGSGGMEYPTLITAGSRWIAPREVTVPESVTIHEAGHQFFYATVATNEFEHAWMDEGMTTFGTARVIAETKHPNRLVLRFFGGLLPWVVEDVTLRRETDGNRLPTYRPVSEADIQSTPTFRYFPATAANITYDKTAVWLNTLERHLGWPVLQRIMSTYFERWQFRHPTPEDFFAVANEVSGQDLTWFFDQVYRSSNTFDYALQEIRSDPVGDGRYRTVVVAERRGEATFPVDVVTTFEDGQQAVQSWSGADRRVTFTYDRRSRATHAQVDPRRVLLLDVNYTNNSRTVERRRDEGSLNLAAKWMVWLQDLMLTYAFFV